MENIKRYHSTRCLLTHYLFRIGNLSLKFSEFHFYQSYTLKESLPLVHNSVNSSLCFEWQTKRKRQRQAERDLPPNSSLTKWLQQLVLGQATERNLLLDLGLQYGWRSRTWPTTYCLPGNFNHVQSWDSNSDMLLWDTDIPSSVLIVALNAYPGSVNLTRVQNLCSNYHNWDRGHRHHFSKSPSCYWFWNHCSLSHIKLEPDHWIKRDFKIGLNDTLHDFFNTSLLWCTHNISLKM